MSVRWSVCRSVCWSRLCFFGVFGTWRAVFASLLLLTCLMLSCVRHSPLPLPSTSLPLPNLRDWCRFVYPALFVWRIVKSSTGMPNLRIVQSIIHAQVDLRSCMHYDTVQDIAYSWNMLLKNSIFWSLNP